MKLKIPTTQEVEKAYVHGRAFRAVAESEFRAWTKQYKAVFLLELAAGMEMADTPPGSLQWHADQEYAGRLRRLGNKLLEEAFDA